jgi:hypothetical protein
MAYPTLIVISGIRAGALYVAACCPPLGSQRAMFADIPH